MIERRRVDIHLSRANLVIWPTVFFVLALTLFVLRIQTRYAHRVLALDDFFLAIGVLAAIALYASYMVCYPNGLGQNVNYLEVGHMQTFIKAIFAVAHCYNTAILALKLSLSAQLLRLKGNSLRWRIGLWFMNMLVIAVFITGFIMDMLQCTPINELWDILNLARHCMKPQYAYNWTWTSQVIGMFTDFAFALAPTLFLRKLNQPAGERILLCLLMGLGFLCGAATIPKLLVLKDMFPNLDFTYTTSAVGFWIELEVFIGICAICIPSLRTRFEAILCALGISSSRSGPHSRGPSWGARFQQTPKLNCDLPVAERQPSGDVVDCTPRRFSERQPSDGDEGKKETDHMVADLESQRNGSA